MDKIIKNFDILNKLDCEKEYGNIEYKRELLNQPNIVIFLKQNIKEWKCIVIFDGVPKNIELIKNIENIDILHSDIQGYELEMLEDISELLIQNKIKYLYLLIMELNQLKE